MLTVFLFFDNERVSRVFGRMLLMLAWLMAPALRAQPNEPDAIARKAYASRHDRVYVLAGGASSQYDDLNRRLPARFPGLQNGALVFGAGYGQGKGPLDVLLEYRWGLRTRQDDSSLAYTALRSHSLSLNVSYHLFVTGPYTVSVLAGPSLTVADLTLRERLRAGSAGNFTSAATPAGDRRRLYQTMLLGGVGAQIDRHFSWGRRNDVQACGRARQFTVGLRVQFDAPLKSWQWRTERPLFRRPQRLGADPQFNPLAGSATLVVGGLFSRY
jgi:hypothetical protein